MYMQSWHIQRITTSIEYKYMRTLKICARTEQRHKLTAGGATALLTGSLLHGCDCRTGRGPHTAPREWCHLQRSAKGTGTHCFWLLADRWVCMCVRECVIETERERGGERLRLWVFSSPAQVCHGIWFPFIPLRWKKTTVHGRNCSFTVCEMVRAWWCHVGAPGVHCHDLSLSSSTFQQRVQQTSHTENSPTLPIHAITPTSLSSSSSSSTSSSGSRTETPVLPSTH